MMRALLPMMLIANTAQAGTFMPPQGCSAKLTVQGRSCTVAHYWTCEGNEPGEQWSGELGAEGLTYVGQIDNEAQWLKSYYLRSAEEETLIQPAADPASLTALLATGLDTYDFKLQTKNGVNRVVGFDRIVERNVVIDGEPLHRTQYDIRITAPDGAVIWAAEGNEYVSETHRRFFSGSGKSTVPDPLPYNDTPIDFIYPGEPGFLNDQPLYDCATTTARYEIKQRTKP